MCWTGLHGWHQQCIIILFPLFCKSCKPKESTQVSVSGSFRTQTSSREVKTASQMMICVIQQSLQRSETANKLLSQLAVEQETSIYLLSKQCRDKQSPYRLSEATSTVAVWVQLWRNFGAINRNRDSGRTIWRCQNPLRDGPQAYHIEEISSVMQSLRNLLLGNLPNHPYT